MSDIQEEQKRLYKRVEENDIKLLKEENKRLKELCNKYEEEHSTTFEYWKHLVKEDYKLRCDKAIEYINNNSLYEEEYDYDYEENIHLSGINDTKAKNDLLNILKGSDK